MRPGHRLHRLRPAQHAAATLHATDATTTIAVTTVATLAAALGAAPIVVGASNRNWLMRLERPGESGHSQRV